MNDRFQFKLWDKINSEWVNPFSINNNGFVEGLFNAEQAMKRRFVLVQSSGLRDKNNNLIFDGDIIKDIHNHIRVCVFEEGIFKFPALKTDRYFHKPIRNKRKDRQDGILSKLAFTDGICRKEKKLFEIIGNIYENEELLND